MINKNVFFLTIAFVIGIIFFFFFNPVGIFVANKWSYLNQKVDDATNYNTIREVENSCRAMIASYNSDKLIYEQYKNSEEKEEQGWAQQAKIRVNKTASTYNEYILKNSFVWKENIPKDILLNLEYLF